MRVPASTLCLSMYRLRSKGALRRTSSRALKILVHRLNPPTPCLLTGVTCRDPSKGIYSSGSAGERCQITSAFALLRGTYSRRLSR